MLTSLLCSAEAKEQLFFDDDSADAMMTPSTAANRSVSPFLLAGFFVAAAFYFVLFSCVRIAPMTFSGDEGIYVHQAVRVYHGEVMYRDIFAQIGPVCPYALAVFFHLFGPSLFTLGLFGILVNAATAVLTFRVASRLMSPRYALLAGVALALVVFPTYAWADHHRCSILLADRKSTRLNSSHIQKSRMPSSA